MGFNPQLTVTAEVVVSRDDVEDEKVPIPVVLPRSSKWDSIAGDSIGGMMRILQCRKSSHVSSVGEYLKNSPKESVVGIIDLYICWGVSGTANS